MDEDAATQGDKELALAVNAQLKKRREKKAGLGGRDALPVGPPRPSQQGGSKARTFRQAWDKTSGDLSPEEQRKAVEQAISVFRLLPAGSSYAQHRLRVLEKALELLNTSKEDLSVEEQEELQRLLGSLKL